MHCLNDVIKNYRDAISCLSSKALESPLQNRSKIDAVFDMLSDAESRYAYGQEIQFCMLSSFMPMEIATTISGNMTSAQFLEFVNRAKTVDMFSKIFSSDRQSSKEIKYHCCATTFLLEQYKYKNFVKISDGDICIDAGACLGDTSLYFLQQGAKHVYSFEIDKENIAFMKNTLKIFDAEDKVTIVEEALSHNEGKTFYTPDPNNVGAGKIGKSHGVTSYPVYVTTLDYFCKTHGISPNFIKMDIEGAELDALHGARETIVRCRPKCAICIYHKWEHRWQIPLLLRDMVEDYNFYIKKSQPYTETVLFATPKER